jgi:GDP-L-fucose synthase
MDSVFHLAAFGWGLGENMKLHSQLFTRNVLMNTAMLEAAHQAGVERYLYTSSSAVYAGTMSALDDEQPWNGDPHPSEFSFGWAKRAGEIQARIYASAGTMKIAIVRPSNPYGPGDDFHPTRAHVVPSLIIRACERHKPFVVWGTGRVERSFVHASDVARAMLLALEKGADCDPINIASREVTTIADVARMVLELSGHRDAGLTFDASKPEGHPGKYPSVKKAEEKLGFRAEIKLQEGLEDTISWYRSTLEQKSS